MVIAAQKRTPALTELLRDVSATDTSLPVISTDAMRDYGEVWIDGENIVYKSKSYQSLNECSRGQNQQQGGSPPAPHKGGSFVMQRHRPELLIGDDAGLKSLRQNVSFAPGNMISPVVLDDPTNNRSVIGFDLENFAQENNREGDKWVRDQNNQWVNRYGGTFYGARVMEQIEFMNGGGGSSGNVGWTGSYMSVSGTASVILDNSRPGAPGLYRIGTGGTANSQGHIYWGDRYLQDVDEAEWLVCNLGGTSEQIYVGFADVLAVNSKSVAVLVQPGTYNTWQGYIDTTAGASAVVGDTGVTLTTNMWYHILYKLTGANSCTFTVTGNNLQGTVSISGFDTNSYYFPMVRLLNTVGSIMELWVKYFRCRYRPIQFTVPMVTP